SGHLLPDATPPDIAPISAVPLAGRRAGGYSRPRGLPLLGAEDHRMDVAAWLQGLGLERYVPAFRDNEIDWEALPKLTAEDLKDLGVVLGGHRRKLLDAIAALGTEVPAAAGTAASRDAPVPAEAERR